MMAARTDVFLRMLLLLLLFVSFMVKKRCFVSSDGISITLNCKDQYDYGENFMLSSFHCNKLRNIRSTRKSAVLLILLLCGDIETQPGPRNQSDIKNLCSKRGLNFCHQNIRGLSGKIDELRDILSTNNFHIFSLSETFLNSNLPSTLFNVRGYTFIRSDRKKAQGGGVGLYIKDGIDFIRRSDFENDETEAIWIEISIKN